uniref:Uncharacterized protein n=1 Tax=Craspedostauros australis TaxID=1486917 RepID=A0A7S0F6K2_9STRA|mmetsp:Transcript_7956/g.21501  ORF Transcript_7956/g.21501 Transcript_7956/m.21501 type:complete len:235 (+) Transcript_7956:1-705(+)
MEPRKREGKVEDSHKYNNHNRTLTSLPQPLCIRVQQFHQIQVTVHTERMKSATSTIVSVAAVAAAAMPLASSFIVTQTPSRTVSAATSLAAKGFSNEDTNVSKKDDKSQGQIKREQQSSKYDELTQTGGQEYAIYVRQFGSDDESWLPCGSIAVPRGAQVSDAIFANTEGLQQSIVRQYPKLKGFEAEFEYGFNLKVYRDDPIEIAVNQSKPSGLSIGNWISNLLSPIDNSKMN